jgi:hypothetical protein
LSLQMRLSYGMNFRARWNSFRVYQNSIIQNIISKQII